MESQMSYNNSLSNIVINPSVDVGTGFRLRTKTKGTREEIFMVREHADLCQLLVDLAASDWNKDRLSDIPQHLFNKLLELGVLIDRTEVPDEVYFRCDLDNLPLDLMPDKARAPEQQNGNLVVNPHVYVQSTPEPPTEIAHRVVIRDSFALGQSMVWVDDPLTGMLAPYWCDPNLLEKVRSLISNEVSPSELDPQTASVLRSIDVLVPEQAGQLPSWDETYAFAVEQFRIRKYAVLRNLVHPMQIAALRKHFRNLQAKNYLYMDNVQVVGGRYTMNNEGAASFIHQQLNTLVSHVTQLVTEATFANVAVYIPGAVLEKHTDRPQCRWNMSLLVDTDPEVSEAESWPVVLDVDGDINEIRLDMGDGVLYSGTDIPHWRDKLPEGRTVTVISNHFVPEDFAGSLLR